MKVYLDNAATTPVDQDVLNAMLPYFSDKFGNASSVHSWGQEARRAVETARGQVAEALNCTPKEIIFTGSTSESDNLAIRGVAEALRDQGDQIIITSPFEHHAGLDPIKYLEQERGFKVVSLKVDKYGLVDPSDIEKAITERTVLVNIMYANNEVGTLEPVAEIGEIVQKAREKGSPVRFHTDAAAAAEYEDINVDNLKVDLMSIGPHKFYGPKGVGILYIRKGTPIVSIIKGGSHERGLRPGTENVPAIVGAGVAVGKLEVKSEKLKVEELRDKLIKGVLECVPDSHLTGHPTKRVPHIASFVIKGCEGEAMLLALDQEGIAASSGSACTSGVLEPSHVLLSMGIPAEDAHGSLRFSLGKNNTEEELDHVLEVLPPIVERLRKMAPKISSS